MSNTAVVVTGDHGEGIAGAIDDPRPAIQVGIQLAYRLTRRLPATTKKRILTLAKNIILVSGAQRRLSGKTTAGVRPEVAGHAALVAYDYLVRVPLIFHAPGAMPSGRVDTQVRHLDIAPTILDIAGLGSHRPGLSPSLLPVARGEDRADRPAVTEALQTMLHDPVRRVIGYRTGQHKLIYAPENPEIPQELYDLHADPGELHNLASEQADLAAELRQRVESEGRDGQSTGAEQRMTAEEQELISEHLRKLGYIE